MSEIKDQAIDNVVDDDLNDEQVEQIAGGDGLIQLPMNPIQEERLSQKLLWRWKLRNGLNPLED